MQRQSKLYSPYLLFKCVCGRGLLNVAQALSEPYHGFKEVGLVTPVQAMMFLIPSSCDLQGQKEGGSRSLWGALRGVRKGFPPLPFYVSFVY